MISRHIVGGRKEIFIRKARIFVSWCWVLAAFGSPAFGQTTDLDAYPEHVRGGDRSE